MASLCSPGLLAQAAPVRGIDTDESVRSAAAQACSWLPPGDLNRHNALYVAANAPNASPHDLLALLCARVQLRFANGFTNGAAGYSLGSGWAQGIASTAERVLDLQPTNDTALTALAAITLVDGEFQRLAVPDRASASESQAMAPLPIGTALPQILRAVRQGRPSPFVHRACVSLGIDVGDYVTARDCAIRALDRGMDSTWHLLRLSAIAYWQLDTLAGAQAFRMAVRSAHEDPALREEIGFHLDTGFRYGSDCAGCMPHGILNVGPRGIAELPAGELSDADRQEFLALPEEEVLPWLQARVREDDAASTQADRRALRMIGAPEERYNAMLHALDPLSSRLFKHFHQVSYARGGFRICAVWTSFPKPPCIPRHVPLPDAYIRTYLSAATFWNPADGSPRSFLSFAINAADLASPNDSSAVVDLAWRRWDLSAGDTWDSVTRVVVPAATIRSGGLVLGATQLPGNGARGASLTLTQQSLRRGGEFVDGIVPLDTAEVSLSDPLVGRAEDGLRITIGDDTVAVSPTQTFERKTLIRLWWQSRSRQDQPEARLRIRLLGYSADSGEFDRVASTLTVPNPLKAGLHSHEQEIGVPATLPGRYRIELTMMRGPAIIGTSRVATIEIR